MIIDVYINELVGTLDSICFIYNHIDLVYRCFERGAIVFEANLWELKSL